MFSSSPDLICLLFQQIDDSTLDPDLEESVVRVQDLSDYKTDPNEVLVAVADIKALWESPPVQMAYSRRNEFQV